MKAPLSYTIIFIFSILLLSCTKEEKPEPAIGPSCSIDYPTDGQHITQGDSILIQVKINKGDKPVNEVKISIDNNEVVTHIDSPFVYLWITHGVSIKEHKIQCQAIDEAGFIANDEIEVHMEESMFLIDPRDGQVYKTVTIGVETWMAENLNYESPWYFSYDNGEGYGKQYNWDGATNVCPTGWHLPSNNEWKILELDLGMELDVVDEMGFRGADQGNMLKDSTSWYGNTEGFNSSGFSAKANGFYQMYPQGIGVWASFWTSTEQDSVMAFSRWLSVDSSNVGHYLHAKGRVYSVRCVKD